MANDDTNGFYLIPQFDDILPNFEAQYFKDYFNALVPKSYNTDKRDIGHGR